MECERGIGEAGRVTDAPREPGGRVEQVAAARVGDGDEGRTGGAEQVGPGRRVGIVGELERAERSLVVARGLFERDFGKGRVAGTPAVVDGAVDLAERGALAEVAGELREAGRGVGPVDEGPGDRTVQAKPPARGELVVERGAHERVREAVLRGPARHRGDEAGPLGGFERVEHRVFTAVGERREQADFEVAPDHRRRAEHLVGRRVERATGGGR